VFTGIVEELGRVGAVERGAQSARPTVEGPPAVVTSGAEVAS
jgi:riboflavin synthase alpha subunit